MLPVLFICKFWQPTKYFAHFSSGYSVKVYIYTLAKVQAGLYFSPLKLSKSMLLLVVINLSSYYKMYPDKAFENNL